MGDEHEPSEQSIHRLSGAPRESPIVAPTAVVEPGAVLGPGVRIGHFSVVSAGAVIGPETVVENSVTIMGDVRIGARNRIFPGCVIGAEPQDVSYRGAPTRVVIGDDNVIREGVTINRATEKEDGETVVGSGNFLMACCHVAHDCRIGDHVIIANGTLLGGHVRVHSHASLSGAVAVHHWTTIGSWSFVAGVSRVLHDIPPFMLCEGMPARPRCVNVVALRRGGFASDLIAAVTEELASSAAMAIDAVRSLPVKSAAMVLSSSVRVPVTSASPVRSAC